MTVRVYRAKCKVLQRFSPSQQHSPNFCNILLAFPIKPTFFVQKSQMSNIIYAYFGGFFDRFCLFGLFFEKISVFLLIIF